MPNGKPVWRREVIRHYQDVCAWSERRMCHVMAGLLCGVARKNTVDIRDPAMVACCAILGAAQAAIAFDCVLFPICYGPKLAGHLLDQWAYLNKLELDFSRHEKPTDNAFIGVLNSRLRQECLNASWFRSMADARQRITEWRIDYDIERPHSALGNLTPSASAAQLKPAQRVV